MLTADRFPVIRVHQEREGRKQNMDQYQDDFVEDQDALEDDYDTSRVWDMYQDF